MAVQVSPSEFRAVSLNEDFLRKFASLNGGAYANEKDAARLIKAAAKNREFRTIRLKKSLLAFPFLLLAITALLSAEWIIRRRGGLA